ncbi:hypothetical protein ACPCKW_18970 [Streptomyces griseoincarnatus]
MKALSGRPSPPLILMPVLAWLLFRTLPEPALPSPSGATEADGPAPSPTP